MAARHDLQTVLTRVLFLVLGPFVKKLRYWHVAAIIQYNSPAKFRNLLLCLAEWKRGKAVLRSRPFLINSEPTSHCNYSCLFCPTGKKEGRSRGFGKPELFDRVVRELGPTAYLMTMHGWGEPLMHGKLPEMIATAKRERICTVVTTNGSLLDEDVARELIRSGLDCLVFSIDGITERSYRAYRRNGKYGKVLQNLKDFIALRNAMKSRTPFVEWQFLVFRHNEHELRDARKAARDAGADSIVFLPAYTEDERFDATLPGFRLPKASPLPKPAACKHLWTTLTFHWNGAVVPCCYDYHEKVPYGDLLRDDLESLWNNVFFQDSRNLVRTGILNGSAGIYCEQCLASIGAEAPRGKCQPADPLTEEEPVCQTP